MPTMARVEMGSWQLSPVLEPWPSGHTLAGNQWAEPGLTLRSHTGKDRHAKQCLGPMAHAAPALPTVGHRGWCSLPVGPHSARTRQQAKIWRPPDPLGCLLLNWDPYAAHGSPSFSAFSSPTGNCTWVLSIPIWDVILLWCLSEFTKYVLKASHAVCLSSIRRLMLIICFCA